MRTLKIILFILLITLYACDQQNDHRKVDVNVARLSSKIIPLVNHIDNADSCKKALSFLDSATNIDSTCFLCYYNKLMFLNSLKQYDKAVETVNRLIRLRPLANDLYLMGGILYIKLGDTTSSNAYFQKSLAICNSVLDTMKVTNRYYTMLVTDKAINLIMLGDSAQANEELQRLYNIQPDAPKFDNVEKKYILSLMSKSKAQLLDTLFNPDKYSR